MLGDRQCWETGRTQEWSGGGWDMESTVICSAAHLLEPNANVLPLASLVKKKKKDKWTPGHS